MRGSTTRSHPWRLIIKEPTDEVLIPVSLLLDEDLNYAAKVCYCVLASSKIDGFGRISLKQKEIAEEMGISKRAVWQHYQELMAAGWLKKERYFGKTGNAKTPK